MRGTGVLVTFGSFALTFSVIIYAAYIKKQFYPSVVYLTKSNAAMAVFYIQAFVLVLLLGKLCRRVFFGQLRAAEIEHLLDRFWYAITDTCLACTIFRDDFSPKFIAMFSFLLFFKCFHWLAEDRIDYMERSPIITSIFHIRAVFLIIILAVLDIMFVYKAYQSMILHGPSVQLVFGFEYSILLTSVVMILLKYILHFIDVQNETPWETKAVYLLYSELVIGGIRVLLYILFFLIITKIHTLPLFAIRPMYLAVRVFKKALQDVIMSRRAIYNMNTRYPDATPEELQNHDVCIICREEMYGGPILAGAGAAEPNAPVQPAPASGICKKLPCGHIFHSGCLRSWFQRQQTCPTCRMDVLRSAEAAAAAARAPLAANGAALQREVGTQRSAAISTSLTSSIVTSITTATTSLPAAPSISSSFPTSFPPPSFLYPPFGVFPPPSFIVNPSASFPPVASQTFASTSSNSFIPSTSGLPVAAPLHPMFHMMQPQCPTGFGLPPPSLHVPPVFPAPLHSGHVIHLPPHSYLLPPHLLVTQAAVINTSTKTTPAKRTQSSDKAGDEDRNENVTSKSVDNSESGKTTQKSNAQGMKTSDNSNDHTDKNITTKAASPTEDSTLEKYDENHATVEHTSGDVDVNSNVSSLLSAPHSSSGDLTKEIFSTLEPHLSADVSESSTAADLSNESSKSGSPICNRNAAGKESAILHDGNMFGEFPLNHISPFPFHLQSPHLFPDFSSLSGSFPTPPRDLGKLNEEELKELEGGERKNLEARINLLRNIQILLDAAVMQMSQYNTVVSRLNYTTFVGKDALTKETVVANDESSTKFFVGDDDEDKTATAGGDFIYEGSTSTVVCCNTETSTVAQQIASPNSSTSSGKAPISGGFSSIIKPQEEGSGDTKY